MFNKILFCAVILLVLTSACTSKSVQLSAADNGKAVSAKVGQTIVIKLVSNPTTGYTWEAKDLDAALLELAGEPAFKSDNPSLMGAGGTMTLTFKALKAGTTTLTLINHQPWDTKTPPAETFSVTVTIQ